MGYTSNGHRRFVYSEVQDRVYASAGNGLGVVLVNGVAVGAWEARFVGRCMEIELDIFEPPGAQLRKAITGRLEAVAALLDARTISLE